MFVIEEEKDFSILLLRRVHYQVDTLLNKVHTEAPFSASFYAHCCEFLRTVLLISEDDKLNFQHYNIQKNRVYYIQGVFISQLTASHSLHEGDQLIVQKN